LPFLFDMPFFIILVGHPHFILTITFAFDIGMRPLAFKSPELFFLLAFSQHFINY
jgi:hypothetical protein